MKTTLAADHFSNGRTPQQLEGNVRLHLTEDVVKFYRKLGFQERPTWLERLIEQ